MVVVVVAVLVATHNPADQGLQRPHAGECAVDDHSCHF